MAKKGDGRKGTFSFLRLPIAKQYVWPESRTKWFLIGFAGCLIVLGYFAVDRFFGKSSFVSNGPLSSFHAGFEKDCAACHQAGKSVSNEKCSACHELVGDKLGVYTFAAHYVYRSGDVQRAKGAHHEIPCFACHTEHVGRDNQITKVSDSRCETCHDFGSFNQKHPQFAFVAKKIPDDQNLDFPHTQHVREIMTRKNLTDIEKACLYCHNPKPDGKAFQPISFDQNCDACHLSSTDKTPPLPETDPANPNVPGVMTLEAIQQSNEPGTRWAFFVSPSEFQKRGGGLVKSPVYHADPWIMENLKRIRKILYPDQGLADLLQTSGLAGQDSSTQSADLYREAVQELKEYAIELRGHPERAVQDDLNQIDVLIKNVERRLKDPSVSIDAAVFVKQPKINPVLSKEQADAWKNLALDLTEPCRKCHTVSDSSILRVQSDQRVLHRAEFNHHAHILQKRCLDCHVSIPIAEQLKTTGSIDPAKDNATIQNIPGIENCQSCHSADRVSNRCVTCHEFHPNKDRSNLLLYMD